jgi:phosphate transport system protein
MDKTAQGEAHHIVSKYDAELQTLTAHVLRMGGLAESLLAQAVETVVKRDSALAMEVIERDLQIDELEAEIDAECTRLLALRQPMAVDLRAILTASKLAGDIERIGDYAKNLAKRSLALTQSTPVAAVHGIPRLAAMVQEMINEVLDAYANRNAEKAVAVWRRDAAVDQLYDSLFRELLTYMMEDARTITSCTHLMFMAKNIERIGDHATNMAEMIHFLITGARLDGERPRGDDSAIYRAPDDAAGDGAGADGA